MQTFLPYPDFQKSMEVLDYRRLGKQRLEALQIYNALTGISTGWRNHPATKMWAGYENALADYMNTAICEWINRGYKNTMKIIPVDSFVLPSWFGDPVFHLSHQSNLVRKFPEHYRKYFDVPDNIPYHWPV